MRHRPEVGLGIQLDLNMRRRKASKPRRRHNNVFWTGLGQLWTPAGRQQLCAQPVDESEWPKRCSQCPDMSSCESERVVTERPRRTKSANRGDRGQRKRCVLERTVGPDQ